ncbi:MAG: hypothetical protein V3571_05380 [Pseudodesulfovibrio sp.]
MTIAKKEDCVIRLAFGSIPRKVTVRLGMADRLTRRPLAGRAVSCPWDVRCGRPRRLRMAARLTEPTWSRAGGIHGRNLHP